MASIGRTIAPARFLLFIVLLVVAVPGATRLLGDAWRGFMIGFDAAAILFLLSCLPLLRIADPAVMRDHAQANDANRTILLAITFIVTMVVLATVGAETLEGGAAPIETKLLVVATLLIAWTFANMIYALHYAHLFYLRGGGIGFPGTVEPGYADFVYFAFTLGMTFQTSDVVIEDPGIRRTVTLHCLAAFIFNLGVLAFTINVLGS
jgi:uncharacterized membrane protein